MVDPILTTVILNQLMGSFYEDADKLTKSIVKMVDKYDETLEVRFSGDMIK